MVVTPATVDMFWLEGPSRITQFEEIDFLQRLERNQLPVARQHQETVKALLVLSRGKGWTLRGKTGWTSTKDYNNGWFVGWLEQNGKPYFFALNVEPKNNGPAMETFIKGRRALTEKLLHQEFKLMQ
ncbi:hypothetical protein H9L05_02975 [Hymenobacter qilianensis]|nr:penicillin-binding transpeptidase domain-containing protein [Hymenobacter qilianensis]QNP52726.1 hypothetical protein H9L05_02975 [Hymenobacter qilianensis]